MAFNRLSQWFKMNVLSINADKTHYIEFKTKNKTTCDVRIFCNGNTITALHKIKFLGIYIQDSTNWNHHIDYIIPKLSSACYAMRSIKTVMFLIH